MTFPKLSAKIIVISLLAVIISAGVVYGWVNRQSGSDKSLGKTISTSTPAVSEFDPELPNVYRNEKYGYEIRYPAKYEISTTTYTNIAPELTSYKPRAGITVLIHANPNRKPLLEWIKNTFVTKEDFSTWTKIYTGNIESLKSSLSGNMDGGVGYSVIIPRDDKVYFLGFSTSEPNTESELVIFNQILSSFKFFK